MRWTRVSAGAGAVVVAVSLAACVSVQIPIDGLAQPVGVSPEPDPELAVLSDACDSAFASVSRDMTEHYATHDLYTDAYDQLFDDGELTDEEEEILDRMMADEVEKFEAAIDPIFDACNGVEELYAGALKHRDEADWGLVDVPAFTSDDLKSMFISSYCFDMTDRPACSDFVPEDWR